MDSLKNTLLNTVLGFHWEQIGIHHHKGINLPLSALHSHQSCGIGEFLDLIALIEWCSDLNIDTIQLLPLNDSGLDPSPYNALSSCALNPIYISLHHLPNIQYHKDLIEELQSIQKLNLSPRISFQEVHFKKMAFLSLYFEKEGNNLLSSPDFISFITENTWLKPYALFKVLKEKNNQTHFCFWLDEHKNISKETAEQLFTEFLSECSFHIALQHLCFLQLKHVKQHAKEKNIFLKGDIPILISPDSADVWFEPHLFDLQISVGVPPDPYNEEGQYWGFPMPKWDVMREEGFLWWKNRLHYASHFYDIYRIDHVFGLFRLWAIQTGRPSSEGHYEPIQKELWEPLGRELLLTFIKSSSMLPIAEDLGDALSMIRTVLKELGICGTKLIRWEKNNQNHFIEPSLYSPISLTCVSTHDSTTLEQWWRDEVDEATLYALQNGWQYSPCISKEQRTHILKESLTSNSLFHINLFSEYLALVPHLVWPDPDQERINIPGTILPTNWTYKFRHSIEKIISDPLLKIEIRILFF